MEILWHEFWSPSHSHPGPQSLGCAQIVAWLLKLVICKKNFHIHVYIGIQSCRSTLSAFLYLLFILKILALFPLCCTASTIWWARSWSKSPLSIESLYFTGTFCFNSASYLCSREDKLWQNQVPRWQVSMFRNNMISSRDAPGIMVKWVFDA